MIFRHNINSLNDLRDYLPDGAAAGDIVMVFLTIVGTFDHRSAGLFRLKDGWSTSGKTDDGKLVIESYVISDGYWERVRKGVLARESSGVQAVANGSSYTLTHTSDPNYTRHCSVQILSPATVNTTITPDEFDRVSTLSPTKVYPFYCGNGDTDISLSKEYSMTLVQEFDLYTDIGLTPTSIGRPQDDENGHILIPYETGNSWYFAEYSKSTWAYTRSLGPIPGQTGFSQYKEGTLVRLATDDYNFKYLNTYEVETDGSISMLDVIGSWGDFVLGGWMITGSGKIIAAHAYHDNPDYWTVAEPNDRAYHKHIRSGGSGWSDTEIYDLNSNNGYRTAATMLFDTGAVLFRRFQYTGDFMDYDIVNDDGTYDRVFDGQYQDGQDLGTVVSGVLTNGFVIEGLPYGGITIVQCQESGGHTSVLSKTTSENKQFKTSYISGKPPGYEFYSQDYYVHNRSNYYESYIRMIDPTSGYYTTVADTREISWSPSIAPTIYASTKGIGGTEVVFADYGLPYFGVFDFGVEDSYETAGLKTKIIDEAVAVTSVSLSTTEPALTDVRFLVSNTVDGTTYHWNSTSSHWESHTDLLTGNTVSEFNAADHTLLPAEVGATVYLHAALISSDGTATPTLHGVAVNYSKGFDFMQHIGPFIDGNGQYQVNAISATQTEFHNSSGATQYLNCSVYLMT